MQEFSRPDTHFEEWYQEADKIDNFDASAVALATVNRRGWPSVRMVLYKGWCVYGPTFYTHHNSRKGKDIAFNCRVALLFYWQPLNRQIRIEGVANKMAHEHSARYFDSRPLLSQLSSSISRQSRTIPSYRELQERFEQAVKTNGQQPVPCPKHWGGYTLYPRRFEFFIGGQHRLNERLVYTRIDRNHWDRKYLSP